MWGFSFSVSSLSRRITSRVRGGRRKTRSEAQSSWTSCYCTFGCFIRLREMMEGVGGDMTCYKLRVVTTVARWVLSFKQNVGLSINKELWGSRGDKLRQRAWNSASDFSICLRSSNLISSMAFRGRFNQQ